MGVAAILSLCGYTLGSQRSYRCVDAQGIDRDLIVVWSAAIASQSAIAIAGPWSAHACTHAAMSIADVLFQPDTS